MKQYFKVTFEYSEGIYCTNLAHDLQTAIKTAANWLKEGV